MPAVLFWFKFHWKVLALCVTNILFRKQTFHNIRYNCRWILLALLVKQRKFHPVPEPPRAACWAQQYWTSSLEPEVLCGSCWTGSWGSHLTWNKQSREEKSANPATREQKMTEILVLILPPEPLTHPQIPFPRGGEWVTYGNGYISFGIRHKMEREIKATENRVKTGHYLCWCAFITLKITR